MNYFELFDLPIAFKVDHLQLRQAYMNFQKTYHPDKFINASIEEQENALEQSSLANKGFTLLNNEDKLLAYVLEIAGYIEIDEKYNLPNDFLLEMMDLNETWMEAETPDAKQIIIDQINSLQNEIYTPIKNYLFADKIIDIPEEGMLQIKDYYYKKKYLDRILEDFHH
jgi:molecular chaperone HscB